MTSPYPLALKGLVIGGTSGIGQAFHAYALETDLSRSRLDWQVPPHSAEIGGMDVRNPASVMGYIGAQNEPFDYVVYSAGVDRLDWLGSTDLTQVMEQFQVNAMGFIYLLDTLMLTQPDHPARVVLVGSDAAERPLRTSTAYCASKAAAHMAVRTAARELGPKGWRINAVAPGMVDDTPMQNYIDDRVPTLRGWTAEGARAYEKSQEVVPGRIKKREVAQVIWSTLVGPDHLNGSIITLNGGR